MNPTYKRREREREIERKVEHVTAKAQKYETREG